MEQLIVNSTYMVKLELADAFVYYVYLCWEGKKNEDILRPANAARKIMCDLLWEINFVEKAKMTL